MCESDSHELQSVVLRYTRQAEKLYPKESEPRIVLEFVDREITAYELERFIRDNRVMAWGDIMPLLPDSGPTNCFWFDAASFRKREMGQRVFLGARCAHDAEVIRTQLRIAEGFYHAR